MNRPPRRPLIPGSRERLRQDFNRAVPLRDVFPQLAEVHVEFAFEDGTALKPSSRVYAYFPAARGFFRYACPCHDCSGEFDLSSHVADLAGKAGRPQRSRRIVVLCDGRRLHGVDGEAPCSIQAQVRLTTTLHATEQSI